MSISFLTACSSEEQISAPEEGTTGTIEITTGSVETTGTEATGTLDTVPSSGDMTTQEIKDLISTRKTELKTETGTKKELNEKDIELLEEITDKLSKTK